MWRAITFHVHAMPLLKKLQISTTSLVSLKTPLEVGEYEHKLNTLLYLTYRRKKRAFKLADETLICRYVRGEAVEIRYFKFNL